MNFGSNNNYIMINTGTIFRFFLIGLLFVAIYYIFDVVLVILSAVVIASAIEPIIRRLKHLKMHRIAAVIIIYIILALVLAAFLIFFLPMVVKDTASFLNSLPSTISLGQLWTPISDIGMNIGDAGMADRTLSVKDFVGDLQNLIVGTGSGAFQTISFLFGGILSFILILVLSFYLAVKEEGVGDFLRVITPVDKHDYIIHLWKRSQRKIGFWLQGQVILGIIVGLLVYLVLALVGIPNALLLAVLAAVLEIIPMFGPIIAAIPAMFIAFTEFGLGTSLLIGGLYTIIQQLEGQLFYPLVVKKVVGISPIIVILALVIGAKIAGLLGAIIAVPLSAAFMEYINDIEKSKKAQIAEKAVNQSML